jgi:hypothetical protein
MSSADDNEMDGHDIHDSSIDNRELATSTATNNSSQDSQGVILISLIPTTTTKSRPTARELEGPL